MPTYARPVAPADHDTTTTARGTTSPNYIRGGMIVLWVLAAVAAGAGIGAMIIAGHTVVSTAPGLPVAKGDVKVGNLATVNLTPAKTSTQAALKVVPSTDVDQSQLSNFWPVAQADVFQPSNGPLALQPGFIGYGPGQGGLGTDAVVIR
jgi:hypothetical protein